MQLQNVGPAPFKPSQYHMQLAGGGGGEPGQLLNAGSIKGKVNKLTTMAF